jgi:glycerophosphoryl diester phosphodiesterase
MAAPAWLTARPIAHRGYHDVDAPRTTGTNRLVENTLPAAEAAIARTFAIECDLQPTADGGVVVFHDHTLDRLTDLAGPVADKTLAAVRKARFRDGDALIPTLEDLLDLVDGRVPLFIELKSRFDGDRRLEAATAAILANYAGPIAVMSFDPASMTAMRRLAPTLPRGMLADHFTRADRLAIPLPARIAGRWLLAAPLVLPSFVAYEVNDLPASAPLALRHFFHLPLLAWTVRTNANRWTAQAWADQIIFEGFDPEIAVT